MTRIAPNQLGLLACGLCGTTGVSPDEILRRLTRWTTEAARELGKPQHDVIDRCRDERACRERVELVLEVPWPLDDSTPAPQRPLPTAEGTPAEADGGGSPSDGEARQGPRGSRVSGATGSNVSAPSLEEDIEWLR